MNKLRALKNKKGFTLVEIIVVLVILAILAAFGIPSMIGFINDARGKALFAEARSTYTAFQILLTEDAMLAEPRIDSDVDPITDPPIPFDSIADATTGSASDATYIARVAGLLTPDIIYSDGVTVPEFRVRNGQVLGLIYTRGTVFVAFAAGQPAEDFTSFDDAQDALDRLIPTT